LVRTDRAARIAALRYCLGVVAIGVGYFVAAKGAQSLRYTASVSAIWPPVGLGIAVLYLGGLRWWPGIFLGELLVNGELLTSSNGIPVGSLIGQQLGNMAEVVVGALLIRRLIGERAALDRTEQVGGMLLGLGAATAISATVGTISLLAGGVVTHAEVPAFWRTWWLGDSAGALVAFPLVVTWVHAPAATVRKLATWEGGLLLAAVVVLAVVSVSIDDAVTYMVFPALIWAAFRFGPAIAATSTAVAAFTAIGITAHEQGAFFKHTIDERVLSTQLYIIVAALTTLFLSAVVCERRRSASDLVDARLRQEAVAQEERQRIARELHDSVSQALFSTNLQTRTAQRALVREEGQAAVGQALTAIGELTRTAQGEMRSLISELADDVVADGLVSALRRRAAKLNAESGTRISVEGAQPTMPLSHHVEAQLFGVAREALTNVVKHAGATAATVSVEERAGRVILEVRDNGRGFDPRAAHTGHYGLASMRSRAAEIDAALTITSRPGHGTVIRIETGPQRDERG